MATNPLLGTIFDAASSFGLQQAAQAANTSASKKLMGYQSELQRRNQEMMLAKQLPLQVGSMIAAGLNPATANGSTPSAVSAPMPSATASTPSSPYNSNLAANILASKQAQAQEANIDLIKSQSNYYDTLARKTGNEADILDYDLMTYFDRFQNDMRKLYFEGSKAESGTALDYANVKEIQQNILNLKKAIEKMQSEVLVNNSIAQLNNKQKQWYDDKMKAEIANLFANAQYMSHEDKRQGQQLYSKIFMTNSQASMYRSQTNFNNANRELLEWQVNMQKKYGHAQQWINMGTQIINSGANLIGAVKGFGFAPITTTSLNSN